MSYTACMASRRSGTGPSILTQVTTALSELESDSDSSTEASSLDGSAVVGAGTSDHLLLREGKIDLDEYLDLSVDRAVAHLDGQMPQPQIAALREVLRGSLQNDPYLVQLAARAAGA